jgi:hypothetical protein
MMFLQGVDVQGIGVLNPSAAPPALVVLQERFGRLNNIFRILDYCPLLLHSLLEFEVALRRGAAA